MHKQNSLYIITHTTTFVNTGLDKHIGILLFLATAIASALSSAINIDTDVDIGIDVYKCRYG